MVKTIEKITKTYQYKCEHCELIFTDYEQANACERSHGKEDIQKHVQRKKDAYEAQRERWNDEYNRGLDCS